MKRLTQRRMAQFITPISHSDITYKYVHNFYLHAFRHFILVYSKISIKLSIVAIKVVIFTPPNHFNITTDISTIKFIKRSCSNVGTENPLCSRSYLLSTYLSTAENYHSWQRLALILTNITSLYLQDVEIVDHNHITHKTLPGTQ